MEPLMKELYFQNGSLGGVEGNEWRCGWRMSRKVCLLERWSCRVSQHKGT